MERRIFEGTTRGFSSEYVAGAAETPLVWTVACSRWGCLICWRAHGTIATLKIALVR